MSPPHSGTRAVALVAATIALEACTPQLTVRPSRISAPRVLAVRSDPPEARPGMTVHFTALVASPTGAVDDTPLDWRFCLLPRAPDESTTISSACLGDGMLADGGSVLAPLDDNGHTRASAAIPEDACLRVGPQVPPVSMTMQRQRPPDPDLTGGYQIPLRVTLGTDQTVSDVSFVRQRIHCNLTDVSIDVARAYDQRYHDNANPAIAEVRAIGASGAAVIDPGAAPLAVAVGAHVPFNLVWTDDSAETYVLVDPVTRALAERTEALEVTWFANGGAFDHDRTGPEAGAATSANALQLDAGRTDPVTVWIVLRDERGGVDFRTVVLAPQ